MTRDEAIEELLQRARDYAAVTSGPYADSPEPQGVTPLLAGARLRLAAKAFVAAENQSLSSRDSRGAPRENASIEIGARAAMETG